MIEALQRFADALRRRGLEISPAEIVDAARAASAVGPEIRSRFHSALAMTLAKDLRSLRIFEDEFETFFASPARGGPGAGPGQRPGGPGGGGAGGRGAGDPSGRPGRSQPGADPPAGRRGTGRSRDDDRDHGKRAVPSRPGARAHGSRKGLRALRPDEIHKELSRQPGTADGPKTARGSGAGVRALRADEMRREPSPHPGTSDRLKTARGRPAGSSSRSAQRELPPVRRIRLGRLLAAETDNRDGADAGQARRRDLRAAMTTDEERRLAREIPRILDEIRMRRSRRMRRAPRGRLWMKRAIRENLTTGGVPFRIPMRTPRRKKPRIVLAVDVSWSVVRASGLFLMLALEMLRLDRRVRVYLFVDHPVDATAALSRWLRIAPSAGPRETTRRERPVSGPQSREPGERARTSSPSPRRRGGPAAGTGITARATGRSFAEVLDSIPGLDPNAASDYGRAFYALLSGPLRGLGRDSVLLVLGDGRTNIYDPLPWAFEELAERARRVIWLVTEARDRWGTGDSALPSYLSSCDVAVEARDLEGLAHGVRELAACL